MPYESISTANWNQMLNTIYQTNVAPDMEAYAKALFSQLYILIPHEKAMLVQLADARGERLEGPSQLAAHAFDAIDHVAFPAFEQDPYLDVISTRMHPNAFRDSDVFPEERKINEGIYRSFYLPQGVHYVMRISLTDRDTVFGQVSLYRSKDMGDFSEFDIAYANLLAKHLSFKFASLLRQGSNPVVVEEESEVEKKLRDAYGLSHRECQIATMIAQGMSDQEIADALVISLSTVKKHVYNAYSKLDVNKRVQLVTKLSSL